MMLPPTEPTPSASSNSPESDEEKRLTQSLAYTLWRLERIPALEAGIFAVGRRELAAQLDAIRRLDRFRDL
jgi:hypothetical protein